MRHLGDLVPYACTLNEPNLGPLAARRIAAGSPERGRAATHASGSSVPERASPRATEVMRAAHRLAVEAIKGVRAETAVG